MCEYYGAGSVQKQKVTKGKSFHTQNSETVSRAYVYVILSQITLCIQGFSIYNYHFYCVNFRVNGKFLRATSKAKQARQTRKV